MAISKDRMDRFTGGKLEVKDENGKWVTMDTYVKSKSTKSTSKTPAKPKSPAKKKK